VSAKSYDFKDDKPLSTFDGDREIDYLKMMKIVTAAGYRGYVGIEYEGGELDEYEGIRRTKKLLEDARDQLSGA
jgi:sugar phosphate isomerase/epimerase